MAAVAPCTWAVVMLLAGSGLGLAGCLRTGYQDASQRPGDDGGVLDAAPSPHDTGTPMAEAWPDIFTDARLDAGARRTFAGGYPADAGYYVGDDAGEPERDAGREPPDDGGDTDPDTDAGSTADPMLGRWFGPVQQAGTTYDACMTVSQVEQRSVPAGTLAYGAPYNCSGALDYTSFSAGVYAFREHSQTGVCSWLGEGLVETAFLTADSVSWEWWSALPNPRLVASGTLARVQSCP